MSKNLYTHELVLIFTPFSKILPFVYHISGVLEWNWLLRIYSYFDTIWLVERAPLKKISVLQVVCNYLVFTTFWNTWKNEIFGKFFLKNWPLNIVESSFMPQPHLFGTLKKFLWKNGGIRKIFMGSKSRLIEKNGAFLKFFFKKSPLAKNAPCKPPVFIT